MEKKKVPLKSRKKPGSTMGSKAPRGRRSKQWKIYLQRFSLRQVLITSVHLETGKYTLPYVSFGEGLKNIRLVLFLLMYRSQLFSL